MAPVFPGVAAALISAFGFGKEGYKALDLSANTMISLLIAMLPLMADRLGLGFPTGALAALFYLAANVQPFPKGEVSSAATIGLFLTVVVFQLVSQGGNFRFRCAVGLLGAHDPYRSLILILYAIFFLWQLHQLVESRDTALRSLFLLLLPIAVVAPWTVRNYLTFGRLVPVRDNLGLELDVSNNSCSSFNQRGSVYSGCFAEHHPFFNKYEAARVGSLGEVAYQ